MNARELGAGTVITQVYEDPERFLGYGSHRWSSTDARGLPTEREVMAVLWAVNHVKSHVWSRRFKSMTDCSALTWLFKSRDLSSKLQVGVTPNWIHGSAVAERKVIE